MKLEMDERNLDIKLNPLEMLISVHGSLHIPLENIWLASTEKPRWEFGGKIGGSNIPFLVKAGTYLMGSGSEFWVTYLGRPYLVIELEGWNYKKVVLTMGDNKLWADRINSAVQSAK